MKFLKVTVTLLFFAVAGIFLSNPSTYMQSFWDGLTVWALNVLPALFPFAVLSSLAVKFFPRPKLSLCKGLFGVRCDEIYLVSLLCGYPLGAKCIADSSFDAETSTRLCSFCSSASPVFVVATVGTKLLGSAAAAILLCSVHIASTILNGVLFRKKTENESGFSQTFRAEDVGNTVTSSVLSVLSVGGLIALFYMLTDIIKSFLPQTVSQSATLNFTLGLLEMTNGIISLCGCCDTLTATVLSSFLMSFGGMCVFAQSLAFLSQKRINVFQFFKMKLTQGSIAAILSFGLGYFIL